MVSPAASAGRLGSALPFLLVLFDLQYQGEGRGGRSPGCRGPRRGVWGVGGGAGKLRPSRGVCVCGGRFPTRPAGALGKRA